MRALTALTVITTAAALSLAARPIAAQQLSLTSKTTIALAASADGQRLVATYDFGNSPRDFAFPRRVSVVDSAGTLVAKASMLGDAREVPLTITIMESDLVLQGQTADGVLTLVLENQNEAGEARGGTTGRWILGSIRGTLRMRVRN